MPADTSISSVHPWRGSASRRTTYALIEAPGKGASPLILLAGIGGVVALVAFLLSERRSANPMMPLGMFASRQFSAANLVTFVVYAALGGVFFLLVSFLQISLGYSPIEAGAASLPITVLMLLLSARSGALAQRIGARIPLTIGPLVIAVGLLMMTRIDPGDSYVSSVLPAVIVFGLGLTLVVAPVTATVLAAADTQHAGIASGINNAVSRVAGLLAVAVLPLIAGLTGDNFYDPIKMTDGFHVAMISCAALAAGGGILAWLTISSEVLEVEPATDGDTPDRAATDFSCAIAGTPRAPCAGGALCTSSVGPPALNQLAVALVSGAEPRAARFRRTRPRTGGSPPGATRIASSISISTISSSSLTRPEPASTT